MPIPEQFKYDVRVRERMLRSGDLTEADLKKHVDALADVSEQLVEVELKQPALQKESERVERVSRPAPPRPAVVAPARSLENELNGIDDDEDDDELAAGADDDDDDDLDDEDEGDGKAEAKPEPKPEAAGEPAVKKDDTDEGWDK
jgi:hypothetical protein